MGNYKMDLGHIAYILEERVAWPEAQRGHVIFFSS